MYVIHLKINRNGPIFGCEAPEFRTARQHAYEKLQKTVVLGVVEWSQEAVASSLVFKI